MYYPVVKQKTILLTLIVLLVSYITLTNNHSSVRTLCLFMIFIFYSLLPIKEEAAYLFFLVPFTADIGSFVSGIPFITLLQCIFILKAALSKLLVFSKRNIIIICSILAFQLLSVFYFDAQLMEIIINIENLVLFLAILKTSVEYKHAFYKLAMSFFIIGLFISSVASLQRANWLSLLQSWDRFSGLWTDPNFFGLFVLIGISYLLYLVISIRNKINLIWILLLVSFFFYLGYRTYSRSYLYAFIVVSSIFLFSFTKKLAIDLRKNLYKIVLLFSVFVGAMVYLFMNYLDDIIIKRGLVSDNGPDLLNGRLTTSSKLIYQWYNHLVSLLFGFGFNNSKNMISTLHISHNTYVDILIEFGIAGSFFLIMLLLSVLYGHHFARKMISIEGCFILVIVFYSFTLSMLSSDFIYLFLGLLPSIPYKSKQDAVAPACHFHMNSQEMNGENYENT